MESDLIEKMNMWNKEREELNRLIQDQARQTSGRWHHILNSKYPNSNIIQAILDNIEIALCLLLQRAKRL